jgi:hypothetical protein
MENGDFEIYTDSEPSVNVSYVRQGYKKGQHTQIIIDDKKQCSKCQLWKSLDKFGHSKITSTGYSSWCNRCWRLNQLYGVTSKEYDNLLEMQEGKCAICRDHNNSEIEIYFNVDRDSKTGTVRGLLCPSCRIGLDMFKEDTDIMMRAIAYCCPLSMPHTQL